MRVNMGRWTGMAVSPSWPRAPCARSSTDGQEIKPHKVRYYLERCDPEFERKMAEVLCVYREIKLIKETAAAAKQEPSDGVAIISYDEKPGIQAIANAAPDLPPKPGVHASFERDQEYERQGTVSLPAGIDLLTGQIHALVRVSSRASSPSSLARCCATGSHHGR
jgi:hypothetical protein